MSLTDVMVQSNSESWGYMSRERAHTYVRNGGHDRRRIPASRRLSSTRSRDIDHRGCERLVGGDQVARRPEGTMGERARGGGRLGGCVRHHAQPSAISNPHLPHPDPPQRQAASRPRAHYHIFSFYILFRTALLLIAVPFSTSTLLLRPSRTPSRALFVFHCSIRVGNGISPHGHFIGEQRLREFTVVFVERFLQGFANSGLQLFFA